MSVFEGETDLKRWIMRSPLLAKWLERSPDIVIKKPMLINMIPTRRRRFIEDYIAKFPDDEPPISAEIDLIFIHTIYRPPFSSGFLPQAVEIKYFRNQNGKIKLPYYAGLDQILAYLKFGFQGTRLWHFFDHEMQNESDRYIRYMRDLLDKTQLPLPIYYDYYLIKKEDKKKDFDIHNFASYRVKSNVANPYYNEEKSAFIRKFIIDEMEASFKSIVNSPTANSTPQKL